MSLPYLWLSALGAAAAASKVTKSRRRQAEANASKSNLPQPKKASRSKQKETKASKSNNGCRNKRARASKTNEKLMLSKQARTKEGNRAKQASKGYQKQGDEITNLHHGVETVLGCSRFGSILCYRACRKSPLSPSVLFPSRPPPHPPEERFSHRMCPERPLRYLLAQHVARALVCPLASFGAAGCAILPFSGAAHHWHEIWRSKLAEACNVRVRKADHKI